MVNRTNEDRCRTPTAIVGIPGGLEVRHDQLKELVKVRSGSPLTKSSGREVVLYWREFKASQKKNA